MASPNGLLVLLSIVFKWVGPLRFRRVRLEEQYRKEAELMAELQADREDCNCGKNIS